MHRTENVELAETPPVAEVELDLRKCAYGGRSHGSVARSCRG